jgi:hypothetical protein
MTAPDDFADPLFTQPLVTAGRYRLPNRDGTRRPGGWMRVSNLASAVSDQRALMLWMIRMTLLGIRAAPSLVDELSAMDVDRMEPATLRKELERIAQDAQRYAKSDEGSRRGNARHAMVERWHATGEESGTAVMQGQLRAYRDVLEAHQLAPVPAMQERVVIVESLGVAGRFDCALQDLANGGPIRIGDLKTQRAFWSLMEVRAQLACYAHADAMWDEGAQRYVDAPVFDRTLGHVMWMPKDTPEDWSTDESAVRVLDIDLAKGWATAQRALEICRDRAEAKSKDTLTAMFRPLPAGVFPGLRCVEDYARRFAACETWEDGKRLRAMAVEAGVWGDELIGAARRAADRLKGER